MSRDPYLKARGNPDFRGGTRYDAQGRVIPTRFKRKVRKILLRDHHERVRAVAKLLADARARGQPESDFIIEDQLKHLAKVHLGWERPLPGDPGPDDLPACAIPPPNLYRPNFSRDTRHPLTSRDPRLQDQGSDSPYEAPSP